jgi:steroid 5-alpha reductase family enzyme
MSMIGLLALLAAFLSLAMAGAWAVQRATGNSGWVDSVWSYATGAACATAALAPLDGLPPSWRQWAVAALVAAWGLRLGTHIARRSAGAHDDPRYAAFRQE